MVPSSFALTHTRHVYTALSHLYGHHDLNQFTAVEILTEILITLL